MGKTAYEHIAELQDKLEACAAAAGHDVDVLNAALTRAAAAEAKLKWHEETQRTYYDVEARAAAAEAEVARLRDERDALRAKLDAVRAEVDAIIDFEDGWKLQEQLLGVLDGKGGE